MKEIFWLFLPTSIRTWQIKLSRRHIQNKSSYYSTLLHRYCDGRIISVRLLWSPISSDCAFIHVGCSVSSRYTFPYRAWLGVFCLFIIPFFPHLSIRKCSKITSSLLFRSNQCLQFILMRLGLAGCILCQGKADRERYSRPAFF